MQPRIYTYKITFEEVPYYYYGSKKEKYFDEEYWGSPVTNKWCWELYIPKKQILELFNYTDEGYIEVQEVEKRLIGPVINDKWCLNENVGGIIPFHLCKKGGEKAKKLNLGIFALTKEQRVENGKKYGKIGGPKTYELGIGVHGLTPEQKTENAKKGAQRCKELGLGIVSLTPEQLSEYGKKGGPIGGKIGGKISGKITYELGIGIHGLTPEQKIENAKKGGRRNKELGTGIFALTTEQRSENGKKIASQKWRCLETGYISNAAGLANYQRARGIDTSKRIRLE